LAVDAEEGAMRSSLELERDLVVARAAEQEAEAEAKRQAEQAERRRLSVAKSLAVVVGDLERRAERLGGEMAQLAAEAGRPPYDLRTDARRLLLGHLEPSRTVSGEVVLDAPDRIGQRDQAAALAWSLNGLARQLLGRVGGELGADHRLAVRLDIVECLTWRAFGHRVKQLAGEVD
jgi:hypothetical protein